MSFCNIIINKLWLIPIMEYYSQPSVSLATIIHLQIQSQIENIWEKNSRKFQKAKLEFAVG